MGCFPHSLLSPVLSHSTYHLFTKLTDYLSGMYFYDDNEVKGTVNIVMRSGRDMYNTGIHNSSQDCRNALTLDNDYIEKL